MLNDVLLKAIDGDNAHEGLVDAITTALKNSPTALQRATALWVWKRTWQAQNPEGTGRGGDRKSRQYQEKIKVRTSDFENQARSITGLSLTTIYDDLALAEALGTDIRELLGTSVEDNARALKAISRLEPVRRTALFTALRKNDDLTFAELLRKAKLRAEKGSRDDDAQQLIDAWARSGAKGRRDFVIAMAKAIIAILREGALLS